MEDMKAKVEPTEDLLRVGLPSSLQSLIHTSHLVPPINSSDAFEPQRLQADLRFPGNERDTSGSCSRRQLKQDLSWQDIETTPMPEYQRSPRIW